MPAAGKLKNMSEPNKSNMQTHSTAKKKKAAK
jgi:hypothetical protein